MATTTRMRTGAASAPASAEDAAAAARAMALAFTVQRLANALDEDMTAVLRPRGLTAPKYHVLRMLAEAGDAGLACWEIGDRLPTRDPDITRLLDRLEREGLVRHARDEGDRRVVLAFIEPAGARALASVDAPIVAAHRARFATLGEAGGDALLDTLASVLEPED